MSNNLASPPSVRLGKLNVGDQILVCDGFSMIDVTHDEAAQALKRAMDMDSVRGSGGREGEWGEGGWEGEGEGGIIGIHDYVYRGSSQIQTLLGQNKVF